jgi:hypothetical protein
LQEEHERCILYLEANTRKPLIATTEKQLLERHTSAIIEKVNVCFYNSLSCMQLEQALLLHVSYWPRDPYYNNALLTRFFYVGVFRGSQCLWMQIV